MLLILISWIYITITTVILGEILNRILRLHVKNITITIVLGLFAITLLASAWAIFGRINWEFHITLLIVNCISFVLLRKNIAGLYRHFLDDLKSMGGPLRLFVGVIALLILSQCAAAPNIIDNESYYIQTIKWLNEYGFVKGVANLHFYLAQTSGWHITQSALNFSFVYGSFNDLSGYCLLLGNVFAITRLSQYFINGKTHYLIVGLLPVANVLLFQFVTAPSPDLPIYVFSFIVFFYFLERFRDINAQTFTLVTLLVIFCLYIKTTSAGLLIIPVFLLIRNFRIVKPVLMRCALLGSIVLGLFLAKNSFVSGHPLFPITGYKFADTDFSLPNHIAKQYYSTTKLYAYFLSQEQFDSMSVWQKFLRWSTLPKLHGFFNKTITGLTIITPLILYRYSNRRELWLLYGVMCIQIALLAVSSPQYRFFLNFVLLFSFCIMAVVLTNRRAILVILWFSVGACIFALFVPLSLSSFTNNKYVTHNSTFSINNIIKPYKNSKYTTDFKKITDHNLHYYSPVNIDFFWGSGDGPLPCINERQINYFSKKYKVLPQQRSENIADGFYAEDITRYE